jgi:hypothetical protein
MLDGSVIFPSRPPADAHAPVDLLQPNAGSTIKRDKQQRQIEICQDNPVAGRCFRYGTATKIPERHKLQVRANIASNN